MNAGFTLERCARARRLLRAARRVAPVSLADSRRASRQHARLRRRRSDAHQSRARHRGAICARSSADAARARHGHSRSTSFPITWASAPENPYWDDVLAHGERSRYARWFDIDWDADASGRGKLVLPVLGDELERVLERGELAVALREGATPRVVVPRAQLSASIPRRCRRSCSSRRSIPRRRGELADALLRRRADATGFARCSRAALSPRRSGAAASTEINYRRFFDVNDLVGAARRGPGGVRRDARATCSRLVRDGVDRRTSRRPHRRPARSAAYLDRLRAATSPGHADLRREDPRARRAASRRVAGAGHDGLRVLE